MGKNRKNPTEQKNLDRRGFLKGAAAGAAALVVKPAVAAAAAQPAEAARPSGPPPMIPEPALPLPADAAPTGAEALTCDRSGSDYMVDVIKTLGIEYVASNPGSSFRGLHESVINYGGNKNPEFITCCHEESSVAMANGYAKIEGKPMMVFCHGTVGLQHASMAVYNAYSDRAPVYLVIGNIMDADKRISPVEWAHAVQDAAVVVRDYVKWDDNPSTLPDFAESAVRAYKIAMTPPQLPVLLVVDGELQENPIAPNATYPIPKLTLPQPPVADPDSLAQIARMLVDAESPVILVDRLARTHAAVGHLIELAEALQAPVLDNGGRMNFPTRHPLNQNERRNIVIAEADVILGLEVVDYWANLHAYKDQMYRTYSTLTKPGVKLISINSGDLYLKSNYQNFQRMPDLDLDIAADGEATLPLLVEAVKKCTNANRKAYFADRSAKLAKLHDQAQQAARDAAAVAWDASPVSTARLATEIYAQVKNDDWSLVSQGGNQWARRLWDFNKPYQWIGGAGAYGIGYAAPAAVGAALANKKYGRITINIQNDGDLMYAPGVLWTAAHHRIPMLTVMHNNKAYHQEYMQVQIMADRKSRGIDRAWIGTNLIDPDINFAKIAEGMGMYAEGPISDPAELGPAIKRALAVVKNGEPALIDLHTQPR